MWRDWRKSIGLIAALCVMIHAAMIVRHASMMLATKLAHYELVAALGTICHGSGTEQAQATSPGDLPSVPEPTNTSDCPICAGAAAAVALLPDRHIIRPSTDVTSIRQEVIAGLVAGRLTAVCPPSTGPPLIA
jgi:hypothetical protein